MHITTPGFRGGETGSLCNYVSFNSLSQWERHFGLLRGQANYRLRVNPLLSLLKERQKSPRIITSHDVSCPGLPTLAALKAGVNPAAARRPLTPVPVRKSLFPLWEGLGTGIAP